jgi:hypothetical protein
MKLILTASFLFSLFFTTNLFASNVRDLLSVQERKIVVHAIDNICGDTWCEGEYNFKFNDFTCDKMTHACELNFLFIKSDEGRNDNRKVETFSPVQTCIFKNIMNFNDVMENQYSLNEKFYESLSDCISNKEGGIVF